MSALPPDDVDRLHIAPRPSQRAETDALFPAVYAELRRLARRQLGRERPDHTLDSAALVHEAYLRLLGSDGLQPGDRAHFLRAAARAMREILVDHARARLTAKRGGGARAVSLDALPLEPEASGAGVRPEHLLALDDALTRLAAVDVEALRTVECRYFVGLTLDEIATVLDLSPATVRRRWDFAKAWLRRDLSESR